MEQTVILKIKNVILKLFLSGTECGTDQLIEQLENMLISIEEITWVD